VSQYQNLSVELVVLFTGEFVGDKWEVREIKFCLIVKLVFLIT